MLFYPCFLFIKPIYQYALLFNRMAARFARGFVNRNPRNNELMGRQAPNTGYQFEKDRAARSYIYK